MTFDLLLAICSATAFGLMIVMLLLPETHDCSLAPLKTAAAGAQGLKGSMTRRGNPDDNAKAESLMKTSRVEEV